MSNRPTAWIVVVSVSATVALAGCNGDGSPRRALDAGPMGDASEEPEAMDAAGPSHDSGSELDAAENLAENDASCGDACAQGGRSCVDACAEGGPSCVDACTDTSANRCTDGRQTGCVRNARGCLELGARDCTSKLCADTRHCLQIEHAQWGQSTFDDWVTDLSFDGHGSLYASTNSPAGLTYPEIGPGPDERLGFGDMVLVRIAQGSQPGWRRTWGLEAYDLDRAVLGAPEGGFYALARSDPPDSLRPADTLDIALARFDPDAKQEKLVTWVTHGKEDAFAIGLAPNGDLLIGGNTDASFMGQPFVALHDALLIRVSKEYVAKATVFGASGYESAIAVVADAESNAYLLGSTSASFGSTTFAGEWHGFIAKVSPDGSRVWLREYALEQLGSPLAMVLVGGKLFVTGNTTQVIASQLGQGFGQDDAFLARLSLEGDIEWVRQWGGPGLDWSQDMAADPDGNLVVMGRTQGGFAGREPIAVQPDTTIPFDAYVLRWSREGVLLFGHVWGTKADEFPAAVSVAPDGAIAVGGSTKGRLVGTDEPIYWSDAFITLLRVE